MKNHGDPTEIKHRPRSLDCPEITNDSLVFPLVSLSFISIFSFHCTYPKMEGIEGNDGFDFSSEPGRRGSHVTQQQQFHYEQHQELLQPSPSIWHWMMFALDFFTGPKFSVLVAVFAVILIQFRSSFHPFFHHVLENGMQEAIADSLLGLCDLVRAYYQMTCESFRSFSVYSYTNGNTVQNSNGIGRTSGSMPPPLVIVPIDPGDTVREMTSTVEKSEFYRPPSPSASSSPSTKNQPQHKQNEIEPAFLDEKDYPEGWLVYHRTLGVVLKTRADEFDQKEKSDITR